MRTHQKLLIRHFTLLCIRTAPAVLTRIHFFLPAVCISSYTLAVLQMKGLSIFLIIIITGKF